MLRIKILSNGFIRFYLLLFFVFFYSCASRKVEDKIIDDVFNKSKNIEILAYYDRCKWEKVDRRKSSLKTFQDGTVDKYLRNKIDLNQSQRNKLKKSLKSCKPTSELTLCFMPRHAILFFDENDQIFEYVEICFDCYTVQTSSQLNFLEFYDLIDQELMMEFGITYFEDTEEEKNAYWNKIEEQELELQRKFNKNNE